MVFGSASSSEMSSTELTITMYRIFFLLCISDLCRRVMGNTGTAVAVQAAAQESANSTVGLDSTGVESVATADGLFSNK